jgi:hypothetical protein
MTDYSALTVPAGWTDETEQWCGDRTEGIEIIKKLGTYTAVVRNAYGPKEQGYQFIGMISHSTPLWGMARDINITGEEWDDVVAKTCAHFEELTR